MRGYSKNFWDLSAFGNAEQGTLTSPAEGCGICEVIWFVFKKTGVIKVLSDDFSNIKKECEWLRKS